MIVRVYLYLNCDVNNMHRKKSTHVWRLLNLIKNNSMVDTRKIDQFDKEASAIAISKANPLLVKTIN